MSRRGEVPFVAIPVGKSHDPREVEGLAAELRIERPHALGLYALWHEFILESGDARSGKVKGYKPVHIAAKLGWKGKPARLVTALRNAGLLGSQKSVFFFPGWSETITGQYAARKAKDREDWARQKQQQRDAAHASALGSNGVVLDIRGMSTRTEGGRPPLVLVENGQKERKESAGQPPQPPALARGELADARWRWILENHPSPTNPEGCKRVLGAMSDGDWALVQWVSGLRPETAPRSMSRKKRALGLDAYKLLSRSEYLKFRPEWVAKLAEDAKPKTAPPTPDQRRQTAEAVQAERSAAAVRSLLELIADPDAPEAKKERMRRLWLNAHPGERPPWEPDAA